ncbi:type 1 fimbrial protein [Escherichia coli]|uniref:fimbrial protein n=1 Tax=Escherichia coli TaxID=562 RepID=UPI0014834ED1|nr:fimbrial protein [Escherichia coli]NNR96595.1 type 1 fimbrial protein [Escherichia coli]NNT04656.1 type 1 fimbrial protein [Escherichia coli]NNT13826.1 type 1 fimbrial protein [Escherichia coli]
MNKVTKTAIAGLLALFAGNAAATDGEIVFDGEILKSACEINDSDKKIEVALGHYNAEQFRNIGERSPKIPFTIPLVNCPMTGWEHDNGTVPNFPNLAKVGSFAGIAATGVGIRIDDAESGNIMPLNAMGNDNTVYQIPAESNGIVNVDLIAYYVSTVVPSEITPGEADAIVNVTLDYR